jgi:dienelactone hydrolase
MSSMEPIRCEHDGTKLEGLVALPAGSGPHPAVLVMHSALGLRHMVQDTAERLAALGYLAVATDMYGVDAALDTPESAGKLYQALGEAPDLLRARTVRWFDTVAARGDVDAGRIAAIGYCFGGKCVLELARSGADVKAVVSYHGILSTHAPASPGSIRGEVVAYAGREDPYAPVAQIEGLRAELVAAGARFHICEFAGVAHSFTDPDASAMNMPGIAYDAIADLVSWAGTLALLETVLA